MDKIGYEYENNTSYLTIQAMENQKTVYQIKMLLNNDIPGLLDISMRSMNNQTYYYYDVTFKKPLSKLYEFGKMTWDNSVGDVSFGYQLCFDSAGVYVSECIG